MKVDAVVLAGAGNDGPLRETSELGHEALIEIGGRAMVSYVVEALAQSTYVDRIVVVGPRSELTKILSNGRVESVQSGEKMLDNIRIGLRALSSGRKVLLVTSDIPLLTTEALNDFLARCEQRVADIYYPIVDKVMNEARFPGVSRTYVRLREGTFTGGNLVLLDPAIVDRCDRIIEQAVQMRKKPIQLSRLLGFRFIVKLIMQRLTLPEIEDRVGRILGFRGVAIVSPYPEIGIDVDKPSDLALVRSILANSASRTR